MSYEKNCKLFTKSHCLSKASLGFLDFLLLLFLYQDKKSKHKRKEILLFRCKPNKIFKHLLTLFYIQKKYYYFYYFNFSVLTLTKPTGELPDTILNTFTFSLFTPTNTFWLTKIIDLTSPSTKKPLLFC